jgi:alpha-glucosidase (family GH31 glycosyl hydrolase)
VGPDGLSRKRRSCRTRHRRAGTKIVRARPTAAIPRRSNRNRHRRQVHLTSHGRAYDTGMPLMRALWLHYPDDKQARGQSQVYLWGRNMLIAPG